jgi:hypothetical protein
VIPWARAYFCIAWGRRCLSDANRCFLWRRSVSLTSCILSFKSFTRTVPWGLDSKNKKVKIRKYFWNYNF